MSSTRTNVLTYWCLSCLCACFFSVFSFNLATLAWRAPLPSPPSRQSTCLPWISLGSYSISPLLAQKPRYSLTISELIIQRWDVFLAMTLRVTPSVTKYLLWFKLGKLHSMNVERIVTKNKNLPYKPTSHRHHILNFDVKFEKFKKILVHHLVQILNVCAPIAVIQRKQRAYIRLHFVPGTNFNK